MLLRTKRFQSSIEIAAYIAVVGLVLIAVFSYVRKAVMGKYREVSHTILTE